MAAADAHRPHGQRCRGLRCPSRRWSPAAAVSSPRASDYNVHLGASGTWVIHAAGCRRRCGGARYGVRLRDRPEIARRQHAAHRHGRDRCRTCLGGRASSSAPTGATCTCRRRISVTASSAAQHAVTGRPAIGRLVRAGELAAHGRAAPLQRRHWLVPEPAAVRAPVRRRRPWRLGTRAALQPHRSEFPRWRAGQRAGRRQHPRRHTGHLDRGHQPGMPIPTCAGSSTTCTSTWTGSIRAAARRHPRPSAPRPRRRRSACRSARV